jgi:hypothetical protein
VRTFHWLFAIAVSVAATLLIAFDGWRLQSEEREFRLSALTADGIVVGHHQSERRRMNNERSTTDWEEFEFTTQTGRVVRLNSVITGLRPRHEVGHHARILYQPDDPPGARLDDTAASTAGTILFWIAPIGLLLAAGFGGSWWWSRRVKTERALP